MREDGKVIRIKEVIDGSLQQKIGLVLENWIFFIKYLYDLNLEMPYLFDLSLEMRRSSYASSNNFISEIIVVCIFFERIGNKEDLIVFTLRIKRKEEFLKVLGKSRNVE